MPSKNSGEIYVLNLGDIRRFLFEKLRQENEKIPQRYSEIAGELVVTATEKYLTSQMHWTRNSGYTIDEDLMETYAALFRKYPEGQVAWLIDDIIEMIATELKRVLDLPTWRIVSTQWRGLSVKVEVKEDYRIRDWMKTRYEDFKHGRV